MSFTKKKFEQDLKQKWKEKGFEFTDGEWFGFYIESLVSVSNKRNKKNKSEIIDFWIAVLDAQISWLISLFFVVYSERLETTKGFSNFENSIGSLLMKIIGDSLAIRHLVLLGFDIQAKVLLRSTIEYFQVLTAIINDPSLSKEFKESDTPEGATTFWKKHIGRGAIKEKMGAAWAKVFHGEDLETAKFFTDWQDSSFVKLSGLSHPSFVGGLFTAIPAKSEYSDENWLGIWGEKSDWSAETIYIYSNFSMPFYLLSKGFPFEGFNNYFSENIVFNKENEFHNHVKHGRSVLCSLIIELWKNHDSKELFPEQDLSIFPE